MGKYDSKTDNGIPYIARLYSSNYKYETVVNDLDELYPTKKSILSGGTVGTYTIGNRSITRNQLSASDVLKRWDSLMATKLRLENGNSARKAVGIVHRDW